MWRRKALESFPELASELTSDEVDSPHAVWREVFLPLAAEADTRDDDDLLARIFEYAAWSARRPAQSVWNAVAVSFDEHLFDVSRSDKWMARVVRLTPEDVLDDVWVLWDDRLSESELGRLRSLRIKRPGR